MRWPTKKQKVGRYGWSEWMAWLVCGAVAECGQVCDDQKSPYVSASQSWAEAGFV